MPSVAQNGTAARAGADGNVSATHLASATADQDTLQDVRQLPPPAVERLLSAQQGAIIVGACPVGDALNGTALVAATSDGRLHCLWPSGSRASDAVRRLQPWRKWRPPSPRKNVQGKRTISFVYYTASLCWAGH